MRYQRLVLILWLAVICGVGGWHDFGFVRGLQPYGRPFKLNSLRDSLPNTRLRARRELSRRRPRGKYKYNLKRTAIRNAKNRNALCLGELNKFCYCGVFGFVVFESRSRWIRTYVHSTPLLHPGVEFQLFQSLIMLIVLLNLSFFLLAFCNDVCVDFRQC